ncbi:short transient receptor potential channel 7-like [Asterias amurensis]|uniref:short transient receptor potential channel 7-like n=1 Tax=Asterias amurensis TaxID=7602 RepID=UPI003AB5F720
MDDDEQAIELLDRNNGVIENGIPTDDVYAERTVPAQSVPSPDAETYLREKGERGEEARYDAISKLAGTGNGLKLQDLLTEWKEHGWLRDWRNEEDLTLYADAITDGYIDVINVLLMFHIPLGDALIRAIDVGFDEAVTVICHYLQEPDQEDIRESILTDSCDNDDFHPAITPLVLAAQRNNFDAVKLLVGLGDKLDEPNIARGDVTLTQAVSTLHIYRALSQPAYVLATQVDVFGHAFEMGKKLRTLSVMWEDFGAEYEEMARGIEVFAGEMLGESSSTEEILALFRYHNTDKYRNVEGKQHPLAKLFEAINYKQKEFIAHPHSQKAIIAQFYQNLLSWNEKGVLHQILLALLVILGYPIICMLYIVFPFPKVVKFTRLPYVMMLMKAGSGFTFLVFVIAASVIDNPATIDTLHWLILIWIIGLMWMHIKIIMKQGRASYISDSSNIHEAVIIILYLTVFFLQWSGRFDLVQFVRPQVYNRSTRDDTTFAENVPNSDVQSHVTSVLKGLQGRLNRTIIEGVSGIIANTLSHCHQVGSTSKVVDSGAASVLPPALQEYLEYDAYQPTLVAEALFGVTITVSFLRLLNLLLVSESVGPLRISLGAMTGDILKFLVIFLAIWFAFGIGLYRNFYSAGQSTMRACAGEGSEPADCQTLVGFSSFIGGMHDLYWSLFGMIGTNILVLPAKQSVAETAGTALYVCYHIVAVLVLLNALIGMLSNTYNIVEEDADTEWKFHRAAVWATYLRPVGTLPPPFNLIPSTKSIYRLLQYTIAQWVPSFKREVVCQREIYNEKEMDDYMRVMKLVSSRYIQGNLSTESQALEGVRPRDLNALRNDILAFRFFVQDRLGNMNTTLGVSNEKSGNIKQKVEDLDPLCEKASELVTQSGALTEHIGELNDKTDNLNVRQETEISWREQEYLQKTKTIEELREENEQLKRDLSREIMDSAEKTKTLNKVREDFGQLEVTLSRERNESLEKTNTIEELRAQIEDLERNLSMEVMHSSVKTQLIDKLRSDNERLEEGLSAERNDSISKTNEIQELLANVKKLESDISREVLRASEQEHMVDKLRDDNERLEHSLLAERNDCADKAKTIEGLQAKIDGMMDSSGDSETIEQLRAEIERLEVNLIWERADSVDKKKIIDRLQGDLDQVREDLSTERTDSIAKAKKLDVLTDEIEKLEGLHAVNTNETAQKQGRIDQLQKEIDSLKGSLSDRRKDASEKDKKMKELRVANARLEGSLSATRTNSVERTHTIDRLEGEIRRLESSLSRKIIEAVQKNHTLEQLKAESTRVEGMLSRKILSCTQKDATIDELKAEKNRLTSKLSSEVKDSAGKAKTIEELKVEMKRLKNRFSMEMQERDKLEASLSGTIKRLQDEASRMSSSGTERR